MKRNAILILGIIIGSIISTTTLANELTDPTKKDRIKEANKFIKEIKSFPEYSLFFEAFNKTDLRDKLADLEEYTLLIPTNRAFQKLPGDVYENFLKEENNDDLKKLLSYHIIPKKLDRNDLENYSTINTVEGSDLKISKENTIKIEESQVIENSIRRRNSSAFSVDKVILPLN